MTSLAAVEEKFVNLSSHKAWVVPILRALSDAGGEATPKTVRDAVFAAVGNRLNEAQIKYLTEKNRLGWSKLAMKHLGLLDGTRGIWRITELGRAFLQRHRDE